MIEILHYLKDPKLWELWYIPYYGSCRIHIINRAASCNAFRVLFRAPWLLASGLLPGPLHLDPKCWWWMRLGVSQTQHSLLGPVPPPPLPSPILSVAIRSDKVVGSRSEIIRIRLRGLTVESNNKLCLLLFGRVGSGYGAPYLLVLPASDELNHAVVVQVVSSGGVITFQSYPQSWTLRCASPNPKATPATVKARFLSKDFLYPGRRLGVGGV